MFLRFLMAGAFFGSFLFGQPANAFLDQLKKGLEDAAKQMEKSLGGCINSPTSNGRVVAGWQNCRGTYVLKNGNEITGQWVGGKLQGKATIKTTQGTLLEAIYKDSRIVGKPKRINPGTSNDSIKSVQKARPKAIKKQKKSEDVFDRKAERKKIEENLSSGLSVKNTCEIGETWRIKRTSGLYRGYFFKPTLTDGYFTIGGYGTSEIKKGRHCVKTAKVVGEKGSIELLAKPTDWEIIWKSEGTSAKKDGSFWDAKPPSKDYRCIGSVAQTGFEKPNLPGYRCVHTSLLKDRQYFAN